jgi:hypothetical protein
VIDEYRYQGERWGWEHDAQHTESDWDDLTVALRSELAGALFEMALARAIAQERGTTDRAALARRRASTPTSRAPTGPRARGTRRSVSRRRARRWSQHLDAGNVGQAP